MSCKKIQQNYREQVIYNADIFGGHVWVEMQDSAGDYSPFDYRVLGEYPGWFVGRWSPISGVFHTIQWRGQSTLAVASE